MTSRQFPNESTEGEGGKERSSSTETHKSINNAEIRLARQPRFISPLHVKIEPWNGEREEGGSELGVM